MKKRGQLIKNLGKEELKLIVDNLDKIMAGAFVIGMTLYGVERWNEKPTTALANAGLIYMLLRSQTEVGATTVVASTWIKDLFRSRARRLYVR